MWVEELSLTDFRNYREQSVTLSRGRIVLVGPNASGKTSFIEGLALAATGRTPRGGSDGDLLRHGAPWWKVAVKARIRTGTTSITITYNKNAGRKMSRDGRRVARRAELIGHLPVVTFFPDDLYLVKGSPSSRRRFIDLLASQINPRHYADSQNYARVLRQRNTLLRDIRAGRRQKNTADLFDEQFIALAAAIMRRRLTLMERLQSEAAPVQHLLGGEQLKLSYSVGSGSLPPAGGEGVPDEGSLRQSLTVQAEKVRGREMLRGHSLMGPHRDDVVILIDGYDAKAYASQGQQRSAVLSLKGAEIKILAADKDEAPLVLFDDVLSELDDSRVAALGTLMDGIDQMIITTAVMPEIPWLTGETSVFRVRGGRIAGP